jgi:hypothetical protein
MSNKDLQTQDKEENIVLNEEVLADTPTVEVVENNEEKVSSNEFNTVLLEEKAKETSKGSFFHYLTINIVDGVLCGIITVILAAALIFGMRAIGYTVVREAFMAFNLMIFIAVFILYKSYGPASKSGYTFGEKMVNR